ncbi:MAG: hypothetical protein ACP5T9_06220, partial [Thermoplasmata archaeon]
QKTRGGIKILAHVSADLYRRIINGEKMESPFLTIGDIDLANEDVKPLLANNNVFGVYNLEVIINRDIKDEKTIPKKILTNVYMYSLFPDKDKRGIKPAEIYISMLQKDLSIESIEKMLEDSLENKIYLDKENSTGKFYFKPEPSIYAMIKNYHSDVAERDEIITQYLIRILNYGNSEIDTKVIEDVDNMEINDKKLLIIALAPEIIRKSKKKTPEEIAREIFNGIENNNMSSINNTVLLIPSLTSIETLEEDANKYNAIIYYEKEYSKKKQSDKDKSSEKEILDKIKEEKEKIEQSLTNRLLKYYSIIFYVKRDSIVKNELKNIDSEENFRRKIIDSLVDDSKAFTSEGIKVLNINMFFKELMGERDEYNISDAIRNIKKSTALPFLTDKAFERIIKDGVKEGVIGYRLGEGDEVHYKEELQSFNYNGTILSQDKASRLKQMSQVSVPASEPSVKPEPVAPPLPGLIEVEEMFSSNDQLTKYFGVLRAIDYRMGKYSLHIEFNLKGNGSINFDLMSNKISDISRLADDLFRISRDIEIKIKSNLKEDQLSYYKENWKHEGVSE